MTNSIIVVTMVSLDWAKEASQTGRSAIVVEHKYSTHFGCQFVICDVSA